MDPKSDTNDGDLVSTQEIDFIILTMMSQPGGSTEEECEEVCQWARRVRGENLLLDMFFA